MAELKGSIQEALHRSFLDKAVVGSERHKAQLVLNDSNHNLDVLSTLVEELTSCRSFIFSVAFITESGLATLKSILYDLNRKGVKGRILTSTFLHFNQPKMFKELLKLTNVEVRLTEAEGFHSKGYIFEHDQYSSFIVGSSNLTAQALKVNYEWNVRLTSHDDGEIISHFYEQFTDVWNKARVLTDEWIEQYENVYSPAEWKEAKKILDFPKDYQTNAVRDSLEIQPNKMQKAALEQIQIVREEGHDRGLVISATGTGKTYLSAFDVRRYRPEKMLFIVHREQILLQAKEDYQRVLGGAPSDFGILSGTSKDRDAKYLFTTIQTLSQKHVLNDFAKEEFDYILIDEVHKAGAPSYLKVIEYFKPKFLLGMTATPERTDDFNIYELFNYNIAYEIRLQEALEEDMLCPFHYFGVTDVEYNGELIDGDAIFSQLVTQERVEHIIEKINYYGHSGERLTGLMFCSRKDEAVELSRALNDKGFRTEALTGDHSQEERKQAIDRLENGALDYIITVDIFNEGVDIPKVNQVVMLRQTQSSIIFIQQLGRGLRKHQSKDFVTIIDFIGNYKNNYLIPVALSGDQSQNKDNIRRRTVETDYIKGVSTVNFEQVAKQQIFKSINTNNLTTLKILRDAYQALKNRIGYRPKLEDFINHHSVDPLVISQKYNNYYEFLIKMKEEIPELTFYQKQVLTMLTFEVLNGKRKHEIILLKELLEKGELSFASYRNVLLAMNCSIDPDVIASVERIFDLSFFTILNQKKYGNNPIVIKDETNTYMFSKEVKRGMESHPFFKEMMKDIVKTAIKKNERYDPEKPFTLYEKYTRKDACRLLNWHADESSTVYGYKTKHQTCPIFVTYHKHSDVDSSVNYDDEFLSPETFKWFTKSNRTLDSPEVQTIINAKEKEIDLHLFVKKDDDEGSGFYYLGGLDPIKETVKQTTMKDKNGKDIPVVTMHMNMDQPLDSHLHHYLLEKVDE